LINYVFQEGETWPDATNPCIQYTCVKDGLSGNVAVSQTIQQCNTNCPTVGISHHAAI